MSSRKRGDSLQIVLYLDEQGKTPPLAAFLKHKSHRVTELTGLKSLDQDLAILTSADCILVPLQTQGNLSGTAVCLTLRSRQELSEVPIIALSPKKDRAVIEALYGSGADCVYTHEEEEHSIDFDILLMQMLALVRIRRRDSPRRFLESPSLLHPSVLDSLGDALLVVDNDGKIIYSNKSALGLFEEHAEMLSRQLTFTLRRLQRQSSETPLKEFITLNALEATTEHFALEALPVHSTVTDTKTFLLVLRRVPQRLAGGWLYGKFEMESLRRRFLLSVYQRFALTHRRKTSRGLQGTTDLNDCLTLLLDEYDDLIPTSISFKIIPEENILVALSNEEAILFFGLLLFFGIDAVSPSGHILVSFNRETRTKAQLTLGLESRQLFFNLLGRPGDEILNAKRLEHSATELSDNEIETINNKLSNLAAFASDRGISLDYKISSSLDFKIRALIPLSKGTSHSGIEQE